MVENFGEWLGTINNNYKGFGTFLKNNLVELYNNTNLTFIITSNSRVGINTTVPSELLDVNGNAKITTIKTNTIQTSGGNNYITQNGVNTIFAGNLSKSTGVIIETSSSSTGDDIEFKTGGTNKLTIKNDGKIGINTTSPANLLHLHNNTAGGNQLIKINLT